MIGDVLLIEQKHERVAREIAAKINRIQFDRIAIAIGGESGSGKSEIAETLRAVLRTEGYRVKILHMDNYYKTSPATRNDFRREHGMSVVGLHEINWEQLEDNVTAFREGRHTTIPFLDLYTNQEDKLITDFSDINVLLIEGLYACNAPADVRIHIDLTYHQTKKAQKKRKKETVDDFRFQVLEKEHQEVLTLRDKTDYFVSPNFTLVDNTNKTAMTEQDDASRLLLMAQNLPVSIRKRKGNYIFHEQVGGVNSALQAIYGGYNSVWFGQCDVPTQYSAADRRTIKRKLLHEHNLHPLFVRSNNPAQSAETFCQATLWPLLHYFPESCRFDAAGWQAYQQHNQAYYNAVRKQIQPGDTVWIHDYQLFLLPALIRKSNPEVSIGFFLHTPFPSFELFRLLPWRKELLQGVLGADLIGFHTYEYARHFQSSVFRILGYESKMGNIMAGERLVHVDSFSLGVDVNAFAALRKTAEVQSRIERLLEEACGCRVVLSVDRLDPSRGMLNKLQAIENFFTHQAQFREKIKFFLKVYGSPCTGKENTAYRQEVDARIEQCNKKIGTRRWTPIHCQHGPVPQEELVALYNVAEVLLVASIRDGMNLISKEYLAARDSDRGMVVLSEFAGGARELSEAISFNPHDAEGFVAAISKALTMSTKRRVQSFSRMKTRLQRNTAMRWSVEFIEGIKTVKTRQAAIRSRNLDARALIKLQTDFHTAQKRLLILDYNGTLVPLPQGGKSRPPSAKTRETLQEICRKRNTTVVIISDNRQDQLAEWFHDIPADLIACSNAAFRQNGKWNIAERLPTDWKEDARPILDKYTVRTPGSYLEEKPYSLIWHFGDAVRELVEVRSRELMEDLQSFTASEHLQLHEGDGLIEIKNAEADKGRMLDTYLDGGSWQFILATGDDWSNENMFQLLPEHAYTIRIGSSLTSARYSLPDQKRILSLLQHLT